MKVEIRFQITMLKAMPQSPFEFDQIFQFMPPYFPALPAKYEYLLPVLLGKSRKVSRVCIPRSRGSHMTDLW